MSMSALVSPVSDVGFPSQIASGTGLVAVEFSAEWCPPCRIMEPIVEAVARELGPAIRFFHMDTDAEPATMVRYGVRGLPTMLAFRDGELVDRIVGAITKPALLEKLGRHVK